MFISLTINLNVREVATDQYDYRMIDQNKVSSWYGSLYNKFSAYGTYTTAIAVLTKVIVYIYARRILVLIRIWTLYAFLYVIPAHNAYIVIKCYYVSLLSFLFKDVLQVHVSFRLLEDLSNASANLLRRVQVRSRSRRVTNHVTRRRSSHIV